VIIPHGSAPFFVPHIYAKFFVPEALGFFVASGVKPPKVWLYAACVIETINRRWASFCDLSILGRGFGLLAPSCRALLRLESDERQVAMEYRRLRVLSFLGDLLFGRGDGLLCWRALIHLGVALPLTPVVPAAFGKSLR
jgi:hypothetical protein